MPRKKSVPKEEEKKTPAEKTGGGEASALVSTAFKNIPAISDIHDFTIAVDMLEKQVFSREEEGNFETSLDIIEGRNKQSTFLLAVNFDEMEDLALTKQLDDFDQMVQNAIGTLISEGHSVVTCSQIYKMLGNVSRPNAVGIKKIRDSLAKLSSTNITVSDQTPGNKISYSFSGHTIDIQFVSANARNTFVDSAVIIKGIPPLMQFSGQRGQLVRIPMELLQAPINKTNRALKVQRYLLGNIELWRQTGDKSKTISISALLDELHIDDKQARVRAKKDVFCLLDFYREKKLNIRDYEVKDSKKNKVTLFF